MKFRIIALILVYFTVTVLAQEKVSDDLGNGILSKANDAYCAGKQLQPLRLLEESTSKHPNSPHQCAS